jgi:phage repressor protein C with HTH and peptisase S24 domain
MDIGQRIHDLRYYRGITAKDLADKIGVSQSYISLLEHNKRRLNMVVLAKIAGVFDMTLGQFFADAEVPGAGGADAAASAGKPARSGVDLDRLYKSGQLHAMADSSGNVGPVKMRLIPVVSRVAAGDPATFTDGEFPAGFAEEFVPAPADIDDINAFALRIHGDSMSPRFRDGDIVICSPSRLPENGDAVVAKVRGDETTCKLFSFDQTNVTLSPMNPRYPAQIYEKSEVNWVYPVIVCQRREKR